MKLTTCEDDRLFQPKEQNKFLKLNVIYNFLTELITMDV